MAGSESSPGTVHVEGFDLPMSSEWSAEAGRVFLKRLASGPLVEGARSFTDEHDWRARAQSYRTGMELLHRQLLARIEQDHPCTVVDGEVGGVRVQWVTPIAGVSPEHADRVLVNLHGGAFLGGAKCCGLVESLPVASVGGYRVCVIDYRQGWEHRFPAASEDVAAVLAGLGERYDTSATGIFGYSAGGMLVAQSLAWLARHGAPRPGAAAICSAGAGGGGDSWYLANVAVGLQPTGPDDDGRVALGGHETPARFGYAAGVDPSDPLYSPLRSPEVMATFPPTMILTGSRSFDLSGSLLAHRALVAAGVPSELHAWEGMWHCFTYNHRLPESVDAFATLTGFFDRHLATGSTLPR